MAMLRINDVVPNFQADTTRGRIDSHEFIRLSVIAGSVSAKDATTLLPDGLKNVEPCLRVVRQLG
jgi:hypothetical protein